MLKLSGISKRYGNTVALDDVSMDIAPGEVHAVLGENGAGKSTLVKIAFGLVRPDTGTVESDGAIGMVHQHFTCIDSLTVAENIALAAGWPVRPKVMNAKAKELSERLSLPIEPGVLAGSLSAGMKQRLELLKALATDVKVLLLDEPTSVLAPPEAEALLELIRELRGRGISVVLITHKLEEALAIADRVMVLRRGRVTLVGMTPELNRERIVEAMIGKDTDYTHLKDDYTDGSAQSSVQSLKSVSLAVARVGTTGSGLRSATFELRAGEIVGVAAVEGSGQRELFRAIAGLVTPTSGSLMVQGKVAFIPEDRSSEGMIGEFDLAENVALVQGDEASWVNGAWIRWDQAHQRTDDLIKAFDVRASASRDAIAALSGGNQQKVVIAAALERKPAVLLAENPNRGLDIKASAAILARLREAAAQGVAVLVHLPDLDDLLPLVDRVVVLSNGNLTEMVPGADRQTIGAAMVS